MGRTLLEVVQDFAARTALPVPNGVIGTTDSSIRQFSALVRQVLDEVVNRGVWEIANKQALWTSVAGEDQGAIATLAPYGFKWAIDGTFFDRTQRLPFYGPLSAIEWQQLKALPSTGPFYKYRILGGHLLTNPEMPADHICAFEYASDYMVQSTNDQAETIYLRYPAKDTDTFLLPDDLILAGLRWMYKSEKGLNYAEDFRRFEELVANLKSHDATKRSIDISGARSSFQPGIFVPWGNWPTSP